MRRHRWAKLKFGIFFLGRSAGNRERYLSPCERLIEKLGARISAEIEHNNRQSSLRSVGIAGGTSLCPSIAIASRAAPSLRRLGWARPSSHRRLLVDHSKTPWPHNGNGKKLNKRGTAILQFLPQPDHVETDLCSIQQPTTRRPGCAGVQLSRGRWKFSMGIIRNILLIIRTTTRHVELSQRLSRSKASEV